MATAAWTCRVRQRHASSTDLGPATRTRNHPGAATTFACMVGRAGAAAAPFDGASGMDNDHLWYCLVGTKDTNTGMARFLLAVGAFIVLFGVVFWILGL